MNIGSTSEQVWTEVQSGLGAVNFMTGMGGFLQALIFGYGGVRIHPEAIEVLGGIAMPEGVSELTLQGLEYKGATLLFRRGASETTVICLGGSSTHKLAFQSAEGTKPIETGKWQKHAEKRFVELRELRGRNTRNVRGNKACVKTNGCRVAL